MSVHAHKMTKILSAGVILFAASLPATALDVGVGASVGGQGGVNAGVGASIGGSGGVNAGVGASVGGQRGVNAGAGASVGGQRGVNAGAGASVGGANGVNAGAGASVGGASGVNAGVGANIGGGNGVNAGIGATIGRGIGANVGIGIGGIPEVADPARPGPTRVGPRVPGIAGVTPGTVEQRVVSRVSNEKMVAFKKRCREILGNPGSYDGELVSLCSALRNATQ